MDKCNPLTPASSTIQAHEIAWSDIISELYLPSPIPYELPPFNQLSQHFPPPQIRSFNTENNVGSLSMITSDFVYRHILLITTNFLTASLYLKISTRIIRCRCSILLLIDFHEDAYDYGSHEAEFTNFFSEPLFNAQLPMTESLWSYSADIMASLWSYSAANLISLFNDFDKDLTDIFENNVQSGCIALTKLSDICETPNAQPLQHATITAVTEESYNHATWIEDMMDELLSYICESRSSNIFMESEGISQK